MADETEHGDAAGAPLRVPACRRWTRARERVFFEELAATANVSFAARMAGMSPRGAYVRKRRDPQFAATWREALDIGFSELNMQLLRQALNGSKQTETVVDASGAVKQVKTVHSYPHNLAVRLLAAHREEVERYRQFEGAAGGRDEETAAMVRAEMAKIRARLMGDDDEGEEGKE